MLLSEVLKQRRTELGYTLLDVANRMGVAEATVQRWESGVIKSIKYDKPRSWPKCSTWSRPS